MPAKDLSRWEQNEDGTWRVKIRKAELSENTEEAPEIVASGENLSELVVTNGNDYSEMTLVELREALVARGLPKYGNKAELIERLQTADA